MQFLINKIVIKYWMTPEFPAVHYADKITPIKKWFFNPVKRWLAKYYLQFLKKQFGLRVIGITGSAGKTTVKEMTASILKLSGKTVWSKDNIDPVYNIPNTILRCAPWTKYLVLEMGVEYPGEMDYYLWLSNPDTGVITNIFPTHTLYLGTIEGVFEEKRKLVEKTRFAILCKDDKKLNSLKNKIHGKIIWFTKGLTPLEDNSNAAREAAKSFGIDEETINKGLLLYKKPKHRFEIIHLKSGATIVDDSYNSNPEALISTIKYFNSLAGNSVKVLVLGDMLELGDIEVAEHKRIGLLLKKYNFKYILGVGKMAKYFSGETVSDYSQVYPKIFKYLQPETFILFKGSRSISLDKVVSQLS